MAYSKQTWVRGEKVASTKLNHMEDGIDAISANGAIDTANLANAAVTNDKLDQEAVDSNNIRTGAIITPLIYDGAVTSDKIEDGAITLQKLGADVNSILSDSFGINKDIPFSAYDDRNTWISAPSNSPFVIKKMLIDQMIVGITLNVVTGGTISVGYYDGAPSHGSTYDSSKLVITNTITATQTGKQTIPLQNPYNIPNGAFFALGNSSDTGRFAYGSNGQDVSFFYISGGNFTNSASSLGVDIIAYNIKDYQSVFNAGLLAELALGENTTIIDGYDDGNATNGAFTTSPYVADKNLSNAIIKSITINIASGGRFSVGTVKKSDVAVGTNYDISKLKIHETITTASTGKQTFIFSADMIVRSDEYVFFGVPTDTARFYYGSYGVDKRFYYVSGGKYVASPSSFGVTFNGVFISRTKESVYFGKKISILGDSISTFDGYIPSGNATYYPSGTVQNVSDTWWYKLYTALGMMLDVNNSWSGSRVTTTGGETSAGCMSRCEALGTSPDVIIVWMGINDFNNEVALGTYDGTSAIPSVTTTFREAYAIMLNKILTKYQSSEVWVCTLPQCERNAESGFPEINGNGVALAEFNKAIKELAEAFGVKVLDHNKCGLTYQNMPTYNPDNLHPNKLGHSLVANNDIRQMDNFVRTRY